MKQLSKLIEKIITVVSRILIQLSKEEGFGIFAVVVIVCFYLFYLLRK